MSRIDNLVANHCPDGVAFEELINLACYSDTRVDAINLDETNFVGVDNLRPDMAGKTDACYSANTARLTAYEAGDILLGNIRPYLKKLWLADRDGGCSGDVLAIRIREERRAELLPEFLYRLIASDDFFTYNMQHAKGAKMPRGSKGAILRYRIPVPPLEIQREIVAILDRFTKLEAELEAELEARRRQYRHYRDQLLSFPEHTDSQASKQATRILTLGEICHINRGRVMSKDYLRDHAGPYPVYSSQTANSGVFGYIDSFDYDFESITWTTDGANAGSVFYHKNKKFSITNVCGLLRVKNEKEVSAKFLFFILGKLAKRYVSSGMGNPKLMSNVMMQIKVPVPPLEEQERIVTILDKFDALVNDLSIGLPAEINARRRQYEYYRDRLMTFQEAA